jgi:hypothetical protein
MNEINLRLRLDPVYRAADDQRAIIEIAMEPLSRYSGEVITGRFDPATRRTFLEAARAAAVLFNVLAAAYRDSELLNYDAPRLAVDDAGAPMFEGETDLGAELRRFLYNEKGAHRA